MLFQALKLSGAFLIKPEKQGDERGFFARSFCKKEFQAHQLVDEFVQCNISYNSKKGTLRGMHFQRPPYAETKLVRCTNGSIYDVIVDLRPDSASFQQWSAHELNAVNRHMLYIPAGFAHGFLSLEDDSEVFYQMSDYYAPQATGGFIWNDPTIAIDWPAEIIVISDNDQQLPDLML